MKKSFNNYIIAMGTKKKTAYFVKFQLNGYISTTTDIRSAMLIEDKFYLERVLKNIKEATGKTASYRTVTITYNIENFTDLNVVRGEIL